MVTFKQFLQEEVSTSTRKSMMHLQNMKPLEFVSWVKSLHDEFGGVLTDLEVSLKVDGLGARFGKDKAGKFFFEGSRTGPIFTAKAFSSHAIEKGSKQEIVDRALQYDDIFDALKGSALMKSVPSDAKVICEIFYNPMGTHENGSSTFVSVKYDTKKLGSVMTIVPIDVLVASSGEGHPDAKEIKAKLYKASTSEIKIVDPTLKASSIDVSAKIKDIRLLSGDDVAVIKSLKGADKPKKAALVAAIQVAKDELAAYLLDHPSIVGKEKLGKDIEGLVFTAGGKPVKVTTQDFKDAKKAEQVKK